MNKQEVIRYIRNLLTKELNEAARDSWISNEQGIALQNTHLDIIQYLEDNLDDDSVPERPYGKTISPLELSEKIRKINSVELEEPSGSVSEEGIRRIVRDEMNKVLRREHLQK